MELKTVLEKYPKKPDYLIELLLEYQNGKATRHLEEDELKMVAEYLSLPESHVFSVVSFYSLLSMVPRGRHIIQICHDVPCYVSDDFNVRHTLESMLDIGIGETTKDGLFTLEHSSCLGCCDQSPVIRIDEQIYGNLNRNKLKAIMSQYRSEDHA